jgi:hypothetical protein
MTHPAGGPLTRGWLIVGTIGFAVLGTLLGAVLAFWQAARLTLGPVTIPWGVVVAVVVLLVAIRIAVHALGSRWAGAAVLAGWLVATIVLATRTPWAGDLIISSGTRQFIYLLVGVVAGAAAASLPGRFYS